MAYSYNRAYYNIFCCSSSFLFCQGWLRGRFVILVVGKKDMLESYKKVFIVGFILNHKLYLFHWFLISFCIKCIPFSFTGGQPHPHPKLSQTNTKHEKFQ